MRTGYRCLIVVAKLTTSQAINLVELRKMLASGEARARRQRFGLSLSEVAAVVGVSSAAVSRWETGLRRPTRHAGALAYHDLLQQLADDDAHDA